MHPEGVHHELTAKDDRLWHLGVYERCLKDWSMLNAALRASRDELTMLQMERPDMLTPAMEATIDPIGTMEDSDKRFLRHHGLQLLREVDNG